MLIYTISTKATEKRKMVKLTKLIYSPTVKEAIEVVEAAVKNFPGGPRASDEELRRVIFILTNGDGK